MVLSLLKFLRSIPSLITGREKDWHRKLIRGVIVDKMSSLLPARLRDLASQPSVLILILSRSAEQNLYPLNKEKTVAVPGLIIIHSTLQGAAFFSQMVKTSQMS